MRVPPPDDTQPPPDLVRVERSGSRRALVAVVAGLAIVALAILKPWGGTDSLDQAPVLSDALSVASQAPPATSTRAPTPTPDPLLGLPAAGEIVSTLSAATLVGQGVAGFYPTGADAAALWTWNGQDGRVDRVDPATGATTSVDLGVPEDVATQWFQSMGVATDVGQIWAVDAAHAGIARIDPVRGAVVKRIPLPARTPGQVDGSFLPAAGLAVDGSDVWVPRVWSGCVEVDRVMDCDGWGELVRIDTSGRGRAVATIPLTFPHGVAVAFGSVWSVSVDPHAEHDIVSRIDPATNRVIATIALPGPAGGQCGGCMNTVVRADADGIWVPMADPPALVRIDPVTDRVAATLPFDRPVTAAATAADGSVWVTAWDRTGTTCDGYVARVDPVAMALASAIRLECPMSVDVADGDVWVSASDGVVRIHPS